MSLPTELSPLVENLVNQFINLTDAIAAKSAAEAALAQANINLDAAQTAYGPAVNETQSAAATASYTGVVLVNVDNRNIVVNFSTMPNIQVLEPDTIS